MYEIIGLLTHRVYAKSNSKSEVFKKLAIKFPTLSKKYPIGKSNTKGYAVYPEPLMIKKCM